MTATVWVSEVVVTPLVVSVAALKAMPLTAVTAAALATSPAEARYVTVSSAPRAVMVSILELGPLFAVMLAAILVATSVAESPLTMVVAVLKKLIVVPVAGPVTVIF